MKPVNRVPDEDGPADRGPADKGQRLKGLLQNLTVAPSTPLLTPAEADYVKSEVVRRAALPTQKALLDDIRDKLENPRSGEVEEIKVDPEQLELNMQFALTRLIQNPEDQKQARVDGKAFQLKYNLTNDQMWTLCRIAVEVGAYERTDDLENLLLKISGLDPVLLALSPDALRRISLSKEELDLVLVGSCSCCCP
jgi:hypothetical protein